MKTLTCPECGAVFTADSSAQVIAKLGDHRVREQH